MQKPRLDRNGPEIPVWFSVHKKSRYRVFGPLLTRKIPVRSGGPQFMLFLVTKSLYVKKKLKRQKVRKLKTNYFSPLRLLLLLLNFIVSIFIKIFK